MTDEDPELNVQLTNFPPSSGDGELRTIALGPVGPMTLLVQSTYDDETDAVNVLVTLSNVCENNSIGQTLGEMIELLKMIQESSQAQVDAMLATLPPGAEDALAENDPNEKE